MRLLLLEDVRRLGHLGDVVDVAAGFARNYLLPQRLATEPTEANIKAIEDRRRAAAAERAMRADLASYLPYDLLTKVDSASMACGLECRAPMLPHPDHPSVPNAAEPQLAGADESEPPPASMRRTPAPRQGSAR